MDDMTIFEQRLAADAVQVAGPPQPVDAAAVFASATTQSPKWRFQSMFNATKFVIAGAIVALFGGFLLAGVLTQQPKDEPLAGASTSPERTAQLIELPVEVPDGIDSGTLDTPLGQARWVHLRGNEATLPPDYSQLTSTPDGYVVLEWDSSPIRLWSSPDFITWTPEPLDIEARSGELSQAGGTYWLNTLDPAGLWRSPDLVAWEQVDMARLVPPGPDGYAWSLRPGMPQEHDGVVIVPFEWSLDYGLVYQALEGADGVDVHDFHEIEPGVYEFFNYKSGPVATVRFEETEAGLRLLDNEDGAELAVLEGVSVEFIERLTSGDIPSISGLGILEDNALVEVELPVDAELPWQLAWTADDAGFASYSVGPDGLVHVHRSQDGRDWTETDVIGDGPGEPTEIGAIYTSLGSVVLESQADARWTSTDGVAWESLGPPPPGFDGQPFASGWISLPLGVGGNPITGIEEFGPGGIKPRIWFQPKDGEPSPIDITEMSFAENGCGGREGFISSNTSFSALDVGCSGPGIREVWIITFDEVLD